LRFRNRSFKRLLSAKLSLFCKTNRFSTYLSYSWKVSLRLSPRVRTRCLICAIASSHKSTCAGVAQIHGNLRLFSIFAASGVGLITSTSGANSSLFGVNTYSMSSMKVVYITRSGSLGSVYIVRSSSISGSERYSRWMPDTPTASRHRLNCSLVTRPQRFESKSYGRGKGCVHFSCIKVRDHTDPEGSTPALTGYQVGTCTGIINPKDIRRSIRRSSMYFPIRRGLPSIPKPDKTF